MRSDEPTMATGSPDDAPARPSKELADTIPASSPPAHDKSAESIPPSEARYRFGAELGRGGMGRVVEAFDTQLGRTVALKEVLPTGGGNVVKRFRREVQITARLEHASIVPLYDAGRTSDGRPFYVMRKVGGRPLDQLIAKARGLDERLALLPNVAAAIDAIAHAHRRGVIHRDIKPQNILVGELGETVVIDWGLAKVVGEPDEDALDPIVPTAADSLETQIGAVFGTPGFMAPEQARGEELDPRGDVFALGATLYHVLAGKPPVAGKSATEMIASTIKSEILPLAQAAPGVPAELATIIAKALAADAKDRYPNAGALAEDVRAFLTGQLVAAHRYTRYQRIARFARRHRAALAVAAAATVAVAALAWFSVARIITERDAARAARGEAEVQRANAEQNAAESKLRADQLLVAHARTLNPTESVATLKQLESSSPAVLDEARALAKSAVALGVAWGLPSLDGATLSLAMTRDGKRLVQTNRAGDLQIVDLELRRATVTQKVGPATRALWVDADRRLLLVRDKQPPALLDPATSVVTPVGNVEIEEAIASAAGDAVAYVDVLGNVGVIDIATRTMTPLWTTGNAQRDLAFAPDDSYLVFGEKLDLKRAHFVAIDRTGKLLVERPGRVLVMGTSPAGKLAVSFFDEILEVDPRTAVFAKVDVSIDDARGIHYLSYRGDTLAMFSFRNVIYWNGKRQWRSDTFSDGVYMGTEALPGTLVVTTSENKIHLVADDANLVLPLTARPDGAPRIATARGVSRFVATAGDALLLWDAKAILPRFISGLSGFFVDDRHVLVTGGLTEDWTLIDVDTGAQESLPIKPLGLPVDVNVADDGRVLALIEHGDAAGQPMRTAVIVASDRKTQQHVEVGMGPVVLVPDDGLAYAGDAGRVFAKLGDTSPREILQLDGDVRALASRGPRSFAALSKAGELVTSNLDGTDTKRVRVDIVRDSFIVCDAHGDVLLAAGNRLLRWHGDVHELARFAAEPAGAIVAMTPTEAGVFIALANKDLFFVAAAGDMTPRRVPLTSNVVVGDRGHLLAGVSVTSQIELVDVPSLAKWTLPRLFAGMPQISVSPDGRRIVQSVGGRLAVWQLPQAGSDDGAWLDELTNATIRSAASAADGNLAWPWQLPP